MPSPARRAAYQILLQVERQSSFASELLHGPLTKQLSERDAALCTELVMGTLRRQLTLDFIADHFLKPRPRIDLEVRIALRMGLYQLRFLDVPAHAAVNESIELVKSHGKSSAAGLVNAVLRKGGPAAMASLRAAGVSELEWTAVETSHPAWLLERWIHRFGRDEALALAAANNRPPLTFVRANGAQTVEEVAGKLREHGVETTSGKLLRSSLLVERGNITRALRALRGAAVIQDEASQLVAHLLDVRAGDSVLDLCAAPGNKTGLLAQWAGPAGSVIACDVHLHRIRQLRPPASPCRIQRVVLDGERALPFRGRFHRILVDAPCSGTGTLRRNPEIKWRLMPAEIGELAGKQLRLLENAAAFLAPSGRMVYSTCSLEWEENQGVVATFLARNPGFRLMPVAEDAVRLRLYTLPQADSLLRSDYLETAPQREGCDGFFAAILVAS